MKHLVEQLNHYAPSVTLLVLLGGLIWSIATWNAEFEVDMIPPHAATVRLCAIFTALDF